ncbi:phage repressor protein CI [Vibrio sp. 10N.261.55.A7]|uniref:phage repressor protein CI n=1 Tax=Vibrio sp. 10N.261.55.A7 TaxID=1880851 RepID=UPI000C82F09E|nr:phage repressor protein CI [Vibrio sp. 10N.261.55.A7]PMJ92876.1 chromosome partitioning protein ParA [Vibrio sp. 10N.261.55.A7]
MKKEDKLLAFDYLKGSDFTENLKYLTKSKTFADLSELLDVQKSTFSTWNTHDRTSHELMVRLHLRLGIPIAELALSEEERKNLPNTPAPQAADVAVNDFLSDLTDENPQHQTVILNSFCLTNGKLIDTGKVPYAVRRMNSFNLKVEHTIEVETNEAVYLLDKSTTDAVSGDYLIDVDGRLSINQIQRLPGRKLAVAFGDSTLEVAEHDIKVIGRVAVTLNKQ